jgi:ferritin-like metal-binding protein YciE
MTIQTPTELLQHELSDMYAAEEAILKVLPMLQSETDNAQVRSAYQMHEQQTREQVQNLDQVFQLLGMQRLQDVKCHTLEGLEKEHNEFLSQNPTRPVLAMFDLGAAEKTEHYEIASYQGLVDKARAMGQAQVAQLLERNLHQEEEMAQKVVQLARELGKQQVSSVIPGEQSQVQTLSQTQL